MAGILLLFSCNPPGSIRETVREKTWLSPDTSSIPRTDEGSLIRYGRELVVRTSNYLGPHGTVLNISNGMNCQNCHLEAGTKPYGNNYLSVASTYPKYRSRSGGLESIEKRINDCFERSLNGRPLDSLSREMRALVAYIQWLGKDVPRDSIAPGSGLAEIPLLDRAADPVSGRKLYVQNCRVCHGSSGEGLRSKADGPYINPPMWGDNSFNTGAGLYRISTFARYIRSNMPNGTTFENPVLSVEEAWDIAAYAVSLPRPEKRFAQDWPDIKLKPVDHPYGPYVDGFSEQQHKYGPYTDMIKYSKK
jgi:thiosulfate dehydrogenase